VASLAGGPAPRLFIFDWDGTLMDSERQIVACMQAAAMDTGVVVPPYDDVRAIIGLGLPEALERLFPDHDRALREEVRRAYARHFVAEAGGRSALFPGARELLGDLKRRGFLLAVATGKSRLGLDRVLGQTGMTAIFDATRCADETASKPDPRMLVEILAALAVFPDEAVMIGDTTFDLEMAARAQVRSIGLAHGAHEAGVLRGHGPLDILPDLPALAAFLAAL
jgi:phosphoglycolate phosphatase